MHSVDKPLCSRLEKSCLASMEHQVHVVFVELANVGLEKGLIDGRRGWGFFFLIGCNASRSHPRFIIKILTIDQDFVRRTQSPGLGILLIGNYNLKIQMKNKPKQQKQSQLQRNLNFELSWQKLTDMETSLRRITTNHITLPFTHQSIETLLKFTKEVIRAIEALKSQEKYYQGIQQNYNLIQSKLANHDNIVNSLEQHHMQRLKNLSDEIKNSKEYYEKAKKNLQESEEQARTQFQVIKKQNVQLKFKVDILSREKQQLLKSLEQKDAAIKELEHHKEKFIKITSSFTEYPPSPESSKLIQILCSSLGHRLTSYLPPIDITNLYLLNKQCYVYLAKSKKVQNSLSISIMKMKDRTIAYYHKHIDYFEKLYHKIPEEILQSTFYRYEILKENIGSEIINVLNSSAMLFEGKFQDFDDEEFKQKDKDENDGNRSKNVVIGGMSIDIDHQVRNVRDFNSDNPSNILEIDEDIIREFLQDRRHSREKLSKEISAMYSKIKTTAQIYSIDVESIGKFINNILINFSKVFVLKSRNLQSLNTFILRQLANWDKIQVQKNSQIEDLKAQLQAQRKLKIFFTNQSMKSEQRALAEQNSKYLKQTEKLDLLCKEKEELVAKLAQCQKDLKNLKSDNREIRKAYENGKEKYNKILQELSVVKQTILRMNIA